MKKLVVVFVFSISLFTLSQEISRESIKGKILIEGNDIEGISVYNITSGLATFTNESGEFVIKVTLNDTLEIRALKYQNIDVVINNAILKSKILNIFLIEKINKLEEIVVKSTQLTGNLSVDLDKANNFKPLGNALYFGINNNRKNTARETNFYANKKIKKDLPLGTTVDGLNIVNVVDQLLIPLFRSEAADKKEVEIPEVPAKSIKYYFGSTFLSENFNIPSHLVEEFIRYVEDDSFDYDLLNYGNELKFLELLSQKSKLFLKIKKTTD